ncbi:MAG: zinc ribbon domain-containing protein, partial [Propionibacteriales bacterium]|nr:zinc ribbon domain-containing protein [Propionibacteriales bacterium]
MMICPSGHQSEAEDYCDTCGAPIDPSTQPAPAPAPSASAASGSMPSASGAPPATVSAQPQPCPNCQVRNSPDALFCEACGYDFTTGSMPRVAAFDPFSLPSDTADAADRGAEPRPAQATPARSV